MAHARPLLRKSMTLVAVKPISTGSRLKDRIEPGSVVWDPSKGIAKVRYGRIVQLYRRGMLGPDDNPWTEKQLSAWWVRVFNHEGRVHRDHANAASKRADDVAIRLHRATSDFRASEAEGVEGPALDAKEAACEAILTELMDAEEEIARCRREWAEWAEQWRERNPEAVARVGTPEGDAPDLTVEPEKDEEPLAPVKSENGKKWSVPGYEDETFATKKAAQEFIDGLGGGNG